MAVTKREIRTLLDNELSFFKDAYGFYDDPNPSDIKGCSILNFPTSLDKALYLIRKDIKKQPAAIREHYSGRFSVD